MFLKVVTSRFTIWYYSDGDLNSNKAVKEIPDFQGMQVLLFVIHKI